MAGRVQWEAQVDSNVAKLLSETKELRDQLDGIKKGNYEIKLNIDDKKLEKVISNLDKMLESLGKGTGDFKEFENLSKQLNEIVSEVKELNKAFGGINDSGVSNLLSSIQSIDKSLSSLSEHITNVNKDFGSVGKNASDNVGQINEAKKATEGLTEATRELANAQKNVGIKSNISSGNSEDLKVVVDTLTKLSNLNGSISLGKIMTEAVKGTKIANEELLNILQTLRLVDKEGKVIAQHITEGSLNSGVELTDKFAIISRNDAIENLDLLIAKEKEAEEQGIILAKTLASVDVGKLHYDIQELAQGQSVHKMKDSSLENFIKETEILCKATDEQILKLYSDAQKLSDLGFKLDLNPSNLRYDEKSGFSFIDLELRKINEYAPETISIIHTLTQSLMGFMGQRSRLNWDDENSFYTQDNLSYLQNMLKIYERLKVVFSEKLDTPTFNKGFIDSYELVLSRLKELEKHFEELGVSSTPIKNTNISSGNEVIEAQNKIQEELKETAKNVHLVTDEFGKLKTMYRGLRNSMGAGLVSDRYHGGTFWTDNLELAKEYSEYTKVESANLEMFNPLEIEGNGANWNAIEYYGNGVDEASKKILECKENLEKLIEIFGTWKHTYKIGDNGADFNLSEFKRLIHEQFENGYFPKELLDEVQNNLKTAQESYETFHKISNDMSNVYGKHDTNTFVEMAKANGYDGVIFKNIIDSYSGAVKDLSNVMVTFDKEQVHFLDTISVDSLERESYTLRQTYGNISEYVGASVDEIKAKLTEIKPYIHEYVGLLSELDKYDREYYKNGKLSEESEAEVKAIKEKMRNIGLSDKLNEIPEIRAFTKQSPNMRWWNNQNLDDLSQQIVKRANEGREAWDKLQAKIQETISTASANVDNPNKLEVSSIREYVNTVRELTRLSYNGDTNDSAILEKIENCKKLISIYESSFPILKEYKDRLLMEAPGTDSYKQLYDEILHLNEVMKERADVVSKSYTPIKDTFQGGHSDNSEASGVKQYKKKGYKAHDTGNHDNERKVANKKELSRVLKELQTEIIASIDESTQFVKEVTDFYDSQDNLVKTQMKIGDKNGSMSTYTTSYSTDKEGNSTAWTSHITTEKVAEATKQASKEIQAEWDKNVKAIQEYMDANTKLNNLKAQDAGIGKKAKEIEYNVKKVEELEKAAIEARAILSSMINPHETPIDDWNKWLDVMKQFDQATEGSAESLAKLEDSLRNMAESQFKKVNDTLSNSEKYLELLKPTEGNRSVSFEKVVQEYNRAVNSLKEFHATLDASTPLTKEQSDKFGELAKKVKDARTEIDKIPKAQRGSDEDSRMKEIDKLTKYLDANTRISKEAKQQLQGYLALLKSGDPSVSVKELHTAWTKVAVAEREAGREGKRFLDILSDKALYGQAAQLAGYYLSLTDFIRYAGEGVQTIRELDTALTEMRKVSDETVSSLERFQDISFDLADGVGTTAKAIQDATADWMRLGESLEEAKQSAQDANVLFRVSEFESIDEATESLVAMSAAYKDLEKSQINDVLNEIGNNYAISTDELASALQKSAATLSVAGNDIYEAAALVTAGNAVLQDADSVGTGLKMISLRILGTQEAKDELASLGEDVDDFVVQTKSKIDETVRNFTSVASNDFKGISVLDDNGNYRSTYEILRDISQVYQEILETDKKAGTNRGQALLEVLAGKNRSNVAASILQSPELLTSAYESAMNSAGSAQEELDKFLESIDGRMAKLENQAQEFWYKLIDSDTIKNGITLLTELLGLATDFVDTFGALGVAGAGIGAYLGIKNVGTTNYISCRQNCVLF